MPEKAGAEGNMVAIDLEARRMAAEAHKRLDDLHKEVANLERDVRAGLEVLHGRINSAHKWVMSVLLALVLMVMPVLFSALVLLGERFLGGAG